jgi:hypothetical protein
MQRALPENLDGATGSPWPVALRFGHGKCRFCKEGADIASAAWSISLSY